MKQLCTTDPKTTNSINRGKFNFEQEAQGACISHLIFMYTYFYIKFVINFLNPREKLKTKCQDKQLLVCQPIRGLGSHLGFWIDKLKKVTTIGLDLIRNICAKFGVDRCSSSWEEVINVSANEWPSRISDLNKSNNNWSGPHKEHLCQVWSKSLQPFLKRRHLKEKVDGRMDTMPWHIISSHELIWQVWQRIYMFPVCYKLKLSFLLFTTLTLD